MENNTTALHYRVSPLNVNVWAAGVLLLLASGIILVQGNYHLLAAIVIGTVIFAVSRKDKAQSITLTFYYLFLIGDIRRIVAIAAPQPAFDPMLLIGPSMALFLAFPSLYHLQLRDSLSKAMFALLVVMTLQIFNPSQGSLAVGVSGAFFYIVPVLWFWVGRSFAKPALVERLLYYVLLPLSVLAALMGFYQTFFGFLPYQEAWVNSATRVLTSLYVGTSIRSFGFSISPSEYASLLLMGCVISVSAFFASKRVWILFLPLLGAALILASGRGYVIRFAVASAIVWVMRKGQKFRTSTLISIGLFGVIALVGLSFAASEFAPSEEPNQRHKTAVQNDLSHQLGGLGHPFDPRYSTAGTHAGMFTSALQSAMSYPLGLGLGYTTFAAEKITGAPTTQGSSEIDLSDMFKALGVAGGLIYLCVAFLILRESLHNLRRTPLKISLPVLGVLTAAFGGYLVGGQYSTSSLFFFLFGSLVYKGSSSSDASPLAN